jgi:hypothetical protein
MDQHQQNHHHPFVDLDQHDHHQAQTDAEALEAIRVAIGQSADFNNQPLSDVLHDNDNDNDNDQSNGGMEVQHDAGPSGSGGHSTLMSIIEVEQMDKALNALLEVSQAAMREMEEARPPLMSDGLARITQLGKKQLRMTQDLINQLKQQVPGRTYSFPSLLASWALTSQSYCIQMSTRRCRTTMYRNPSTTLCAQSMMR